MNYLLAKTKGRNGDFFKIISNEEIFKLPKDLDSNVVYDSDHKLDEDTWFSIKEFSKKEFAIDFIKKKFISADYNQIVKSNYTNIDYLVSYQTGVYYFQKVFSKQFIKKKYVTISDEPTLHEDEPIIVIDSLPGAIYVKAEDILYFKNLNSIMNIFKGIDTLYREATQNETETFLANDFIQLNNGYSVDNVKTANRKRIAMAMDTLSKFTPTEKNGIFKYINGYCKDLKFDKKTSSFTIECEDDLKHLLYGIEQRYYTTKLGAEKRLANSITPL